MHQLVSVCLSPRETPERTCQIVIQKMDGRYPRCRSRSRRRRRWGPLSWTPVLFVMLLPARHTSLLLSQRTSALGARRHGESSGAARTAALCGALHLPPHRDGHTSHEPSAEAGSERQVIEMQATTHFHTIELSDSCRPGTITRHTGHPVKLAAKGESSRCEATQNQTRSSAAIAVGQGRSYVTQAIQ